VLSSLANSNNSIVRPLFYCSTTITVTVVLHFQKCLEMIKWNLIAWIFTIFSRTLSRDISVLQYTTAPRNFCKKKLLLFFLVTVILSRKNQYKKIWTDP